MGHHEAARPGQVDHYYLYVIIDVYSRYVPGWLLAEAESAELAKTLLGQTVTKQGVDRDQLTVHADRGSSMASKSVAHLLADLGVTKSHSRPHTSNDNPYSEAQFKTLKYRPDFPDRFGSIQDARAFCQDFFAYYNTVHRHCGIGLLTPADVHHHRAEQVRDARAKTLARAYYARPTASSANHPNRPRYRAQPGSQARILRPGRSVNIRQNCLIQLDRFRARLKSVGSRRPPCPTATRNHPVTIG
jgi:putative transposase